MRLKCRSRARRRGSRLLALIGIGIALVPATVRAQTNSGALDLLLPIGARATAMGAASVAEQGSEAIWWNPAGLARLTKPAFALDHFENIFVTSGDAISFILPAGAVGVFGIAARLFNYDTLSTTSQTGEDIGITSPRSIAVGASFAASFGQRFSAGFSFRVYQLNVACSGVCADVFPTSPYTGYLDAGIQFRPSAAGPLQFGVLLRNVGPNLQVHDQPQADALPARLHVGMSYQPTSPSWDPSLRVTGTAEFVSSPALSSKELHFGGELAYTSGSTLLLVRGGYVMQGATGGGERGTGPSIGVGLASGRVQVDLARIFETFSTNLGKPPTYISIRVGL